MIHRSSDNSTIAEAYGKRVIAMLKAKGFLRPEWPMLAILAIALPMVTIRPVEAAPTSFFDSVEIRSDNLAPFKKWQGAIHRYSEERAKERSRDCASTEFNPCHYAELQAFLLGLVDKQPWDQIVAVNDYMNTRRYISDPRNWGVSDYWATPGEFMAKFGDCEDYAIAKYLSLRQLGWSDRQLRVAAVRDLNLQTGHAVLIVYHEGRTWLLDNQIKQVIDTGQVRHYEAVFSINETAWWLHRRGAGE